MNLIPPIPCPSCGARESRCLGPIAPGISFAGRRLKEPVPGGNLYACSCCALWFRWPRLSSGRLTELYQDAAEGQWGTRAENRAEWQVAKRWIEEHIRNGRLLDIGCFDGRFLELMDGSWTRFGIEINVRAARRAEQQRSVEVIGHEVEKLAEVGKPFDVITAFDVIEHVADPLHMLRLAAESVRPGGAIVVATGNTQAPSWQLMKNQYWYCSIPEHLSFIGEDWARWAAERLGLEVVFLERYSHDAERIWTRTIRQALLSLLLKSAPRAFGALRAAGLSEINIDDRDELKTYPPLWSAAFDHFLVIFRR